MTILITHDLDEQQKKQLEAEAPHAKFLYRQASAATDAELAEADVIIGHLPAKRLSACTRLKWLQLPSAGADTYAAALKDTGITLTNATGAYGLAISEHMMAMALCLMKKMHLYLANGQQQLWHDEGNVMSFYEATVLVVGLGDIGGAFAQRAHAMGSHVIGIRRVMRDKPDFVDEIASIDQLNDILPRADIIALSLPATAETKKLFDRSRFQAMKRGAIILNVGRGSAIDQDALCEALESGHLGGAGLDVTSPEPLPAGHRLWTAPNLLLTPHISGGSHLYETAKRSLDIFAKNLKAYMAGEPLQNIVDFQTGYRRIEK